MLSRKRKSKCDEKAPCSSCILRGTEEVCHLPDKQTAANTSRTDSPVAYTSRAQLQSSGSGYRERSPSGEESSVRPGLKRQRTSRLYAATSPGQQLSDAYEEISRLRRGLDRLEDAFGACSSTTPPAPLPFQTSKRWPKTVSLTRESDRIPTPDLSLVREATRIFPSRTDCEILLEYLTQETDWLVNCTTAYWLQPIWTRFVYGGRVTQTEVAVISAALAVAAFLLSESPHVYYILSEPASTLHLRLFQHTLQILRLESDLLRFGKTNDQVKLDPTIAFGLALDYVRFSGTRRKEGWIQLRASIRKRMIEGGLMDESSSVWEAWNEAEKDVVRRIVWQLVVDESWSSLYADQRGQYSSHFSLQKGRIAVRHPYWLPVRLASAFGPGPPLSDSPEHTDMTSSFRPAAKITTRVHRLKDEEESSNAAEISELAIILAEWAARASEYISAIKSWQKESVAMAPFHRDQEREALLVQGVTLCDQIKAWRESIQPVVCEPGALDATDFHDCRRASQASTIHTGVRQILNAMLAAWVTQDLVADVSSRTLIQLQREALSNAKDTVRTIGLTRTLLSCGITTYFGCWAAFSFFNAATTLAIPLLGGQRVREEARKAREKLGGIGLTDRYTSSGKKEDGRTPTKTKGLQPPAGSAASSMITSGVLSMDELRTLAPDILQILEFLPMIQTSPLGKEATQRLASLVDAYGIGVPGSGTHSPHEPYVASTPSSHQNRMLAMFPHREEPADARNGFAPAAPAMALSLSGSSPTSAPLNAVSAPLQDSRGYAVLDSLVALDDAWWDQLFATTET
ncbi:hypothetical protein BCV69DRAFT_300150 [Microstroma glucosiphilum]|uniref:Zn(2)-C6 fungal-type domain-containing protein n=1 Tax=Pseudomicrostroma glucosiphilum TaxID=1684307 RepID=A0A316UA06_9BASI|nr:hypothetical protein BCV69DRAFT_300150 [Pseudomicrostroma glucosiphilum]PWN19845.1 hypothetical protein BCV69DRAFT_300150 [Pseudomicrostroma glucosiphilum]